MLNSEELIAYGSGILIMDNPKIQIEYTRFLKTSYIYAGIITIRKIWIFDFNINTTPIIILKPDEKDYDIDLIILITAKI